MTDATKDAVGYGRPPKHSRFQRGRSGNPTGRPKRKPSFWAALQTELAASAPTTHRQRAGSKLQMLVKVLVNSAISGNARAQALLVGALVRLGDVEDKETVSLTSDDEAILEAYVSGELKRHTAEAEAPLSPEDETDE